MIEIWKDIEGYEGLYQVSNKRNVKSLNYRGSGKEGILKRQKDKCGYLIVRLCKEGEAKYYLTHRLVAQTFLENPKNYPIINHKDENPSNNCVENLEWCTSEYNNNYGTRNEKASKSLSKPVMCVETGEVFSSGIEAQRKTGIWVSNINCCANGKVKTAGRYHWIKV